MGDFYPLNLYRDGAHFVWDGRPTDTMLVASKDEHEAAVADGWMESLDYARHVPHQPAPDGLSELTDDELRDRLKDTGRILHHKTGRAKLLEALREAA